MTPIQAIRKKCLACSNYQPKEVRFCPIRDCSIFEYRFGKNPSRKGIGGRLVTVCIENAKSVEQNDAGRAF